MKRRQNEDNADYRENKPRKASTHKKEFKPPKKISPRYLYNSGLAYLQRFPASSMHFKTVMKRKISKSCRHHTEQNMDECLTTLDDVVIQFKELGLLDDDAYLKGMITSLRRRGLSSAQIHSKLMQKGYQRGDITNALNIYDNEELSECENGDSHAALIFARRKKLGPFDRLQKRDTDKSMATMARAGYSYDIAKKILSMSEEDLPENLKQFL